MVQQPMLEELTVQNFILIEQSIIKFRNGLNVLTGETGAGKSILLGAIGMLLGEKADTANIRSGCDECVVAGTFSVADGSMAEQWLLERSLKLEEGRLLIRRVIKHSGRGSIHIQSVPMTIQELQQLSGYLIDVHGQHAHQSLLKQSAHRKLVDEYGALAPLSASLRLLYEELTVLQKKRDSFSANHAEQVRELELMQHAVKEIENANIAPNEQQQLEQEIRVLSKFQQLKTLQEDLVKLLQTHQYAVVSQLQKTRPLIDQMKQIDSDYSALADRIDASYYDLEDIVQSLDTKIKSAEYNAGELQDKQKRLDLIHTLIHKYARLENRTMESVVNYATEARRKIQELQAWEQNKDVTIKKLTELHKRLLEQAMQLSKQRTQIAAKLQANVEPIIRKLGMNDGAFKIEVAQQKNKNGVLMCGANGADKVEFLIRTNSGEPMQPLRSIASGGELSRIMLALKSVLIDADKIPTMIFDEIDTGIGGVVARSVGEYLRGLARGKQILCVTHIATIAVQANHHLTVKKVTKGERTVTVVEEIDSNKRTEELARMLSGDTISQASLEHAQQLISDTQ